MRIQLVPWLLITLFTSVSVLADQPVTLRLTDGSERLVVNRIGEKGKSLSLSKNEIEVMYLYPGKSPAIEPEILEFLKTKDPEIFRGAKEMTSALEVSQGNNKFYIGLLGTGNLKELKSKQGRLIKCKIILISVQKNDQSLSIPLIQQVE